MDAMIFVYYMLIGFSAFMIFAVFATYVYRWIADMEPKFSRYLIHAAFYLLLGSVSAGLFIGEIRSNQAEVDRQNEVEISEEQSSASKADEMQVDAGEKLLAAVEAELEANPEIHHAEVASIELLKAKAGVPPLNYDVAVNYEDGSQVLYSWTDETMTNLQRTY